LISSGHYGPSYLGVSVATLNPDIAGANEITRQSTRRIIQYMTAGGPAEKAD